MEYTTLKEITDNTHPCRPWNHLVTEIYECSLKRSSRATGTRVTNRFSKQEFSEWLFKQPRFEKIYNDWVNCRPKHHIDWKYDDFKPSIQRLDYTKENSFDNMKLVIWKDNLERSWHAGGIEYSSVNIYGKLDEITDKRSRNNKPIPRKINSYKVWDNLIPQNQERLSEMANPEEYTYGARFKHLVEALKKYSLRDLPFQYVEQLAEYRGVELNQFQEWYSEEMRTCRDSFEITGRNGAPYCFDINQRDIYPSQKPIYIDGKFQGVFRKETKIGEVSFYRAECKVDVYGWKIEGKALCVGTEEYYTYINLIKEIRSGRVEIN